MNQWRWRMKRAREGMAEVAPLEAASRRGLPVAVQRGVAVSIRPDVHARFLRVKERADALVAEELAALKGAPMARIEYGRHGYPDQERVEIRPRSDPKPYARREDGPQGWQDDEGW